MGLWLKRFAIIAVLGFPAAVVGSRLGWFDFRLGFTIIRYTFYLAIAVFIVGLLVSYIQRLSNPISAKKARFGAYLCLLPIIGLAMQIYLVETLPSIHNISTDVVDPPKFDKVVELRGDDSNPLAYDINELAAIQQEAYPDVKTLITSGSVEEVYNKALSVAESMGWEIVDATPSSGIIEATETTLLWEFKDDIVIRISEVDESIAVDLRSVSRVGGSDLGANARRIRKFLKVVNK